MMRKRKQTQRAASITCIALAAALAIFMTLQACWTAPEPRFTSTHPAALMSPLWGLSSESLVNSGDVKALDALPGVGEVISQRIIETREAMGGFRLPEDLMLVKGIGEKTFEKIMEALDEALVQLPEMTE